MRRTATEAGAGRTSASLAQLPGDAFVNLGGACLGTPAALFVQGTLFAFVRNTDQSLGLCTVSAPAPGAWRVIAGPIASSPGVTAAPGGTVAVVAVLQSGPIAVSYVDPFQGTGTRFAPIGGGVPSRSGFAGDPLIAANTDQRLEALALDGGGTLWHSYQSTAGPGGAWSKWSILGTGFLAGARFAALLDAGTGHLHVVVLGADNLMYEATQAAGGGHDGWSPFQVIASGSPQFVGGAATCLSASGSFVYAGYNADQLFSPTPLINCSPPTWPAWATITIDPSQTLLPTSVPVLVDDQGIPQLVCQTIAGQVLLISQGPIPGFWRAPVAVGAPSPSFLGTLCAVAAAGSGAVLNRAFDDSLWVAAWPDLHE